MADEKIQVGIEATTTGLKTGTDEAKVINKATTEQIAADWATMSTEVKAAVAGMGASIKETMLGVKESIIGMQEVFIGLGAVFAGGAMFGEVIHKTTEWAEGVELLSTKMGISAEEASVLQVALNHVGITANEYAQGAQAIARALATNSKAFQGLDISVRNTDGSFKNSQVIMTEIISKLSNMKEGTDRNVAAFEIMKRTHMDINALLRLNADTMDAAAKKAEVLGLVMNEQGVNAAISYKMSLNDLSLTGDAVAMAIGQNLIPEIVSLTDDLLKIPKVIHDFYTENQSLIDGIAGGVIVWGAYNAALALYELRLPIISGLESAYILALYGEDAIVKLLTLDFTALSGAEMLACGGWVVAGIVAIDAAANGLHKAMNDVVDIVVEAARAFEALMYKAAAVMDILRGDPKAMMEDWQKGMQITAHIYDGIGSDWVAKIESATAGMLPLIDKIPNIPTGSEDAPTLPGNTPKPPKTAKGTDDNARKATEMNLTNDLTAIQDKFTQQVDKDIKDRIQTEKDANEEIYNSAVTTIDGEIEANRHKTEMGQQSADKELQIASQLNIKKLEAERTYLEAERKELAAFGDSGSKTYMDLLNKLDQVTLGIKVETDKQDEYLKRPWKDLTTQIQSSLSTAISSILKGTTTIKGAFQNMARSILDTMIQMWAQQEAAAIMGSITASAAAEGSTATATGSILGMLEAVGTALSSMPWFEWVGLAILAGVASAQSSGNQQTNAGRQQSSYFGSSAVGSLPSYDSGSWAVPGDMTANIHKDELIVPAKGGAADAVRSMLSGNGGGSGGGGVTHAPTYNVSAIDGRSFSRYLRDSSREVTQGIYRTSRNMGQPNPTRWGL